LKTNLVQFKEFFAIKKTKLISLIFLHILDGQGLSPIPLKNKGASPFPMPSNGKTLLNNIPSPQVKMKTINKKSPCPPHSRNNSLNNHNNNNNKSTEVCEFRL
jgi:hypothetical protein